MNLSAPFIQRPITTVLLMVAIFVSGVFAYHWLPVSNLPDVDYPVITVSGVMPGASAETMANTVAMPLEKEFMTVPGLTSVTSTSTVGNTSVVLQFEVSKNLDSAAQDVAAAISRAQPRLPAQMRERPTYKKVNPADAPIIYLALTSSTMTSGELYTYGYNFIGQRLSMLEGVAQVQCYGAPYAVRIQVDPAKMASLNITLDEVSAAITGNNPHLPMGQLYGQNSTATFMSANGVSSAEEAATLVVGHGKRAPIRVQDIGRAVDGLQNRFVFSEYLTADEQLPTVVLAVQRQPGANTVTVAQRIEAYLPVLEKQMPASLNLNVIFDRSLSIRESTKEVQITLLVSFVLVVLVIFLCLGKVVETIIPSVVLPMSVVGTLPFMYYFGFSIDNLSLLAFILAMGFIIDDAIVVMENIVRRVEAGEGPWRAAMLGSQQIGFTILSMTLSLVAVFIPLIFMGGVIGKIFREFAIVLAVITVVSGIISVTFTPMLCSRFIKPRAGETPGALSRMATAIHDAMIGWYRRSLTRALRRRRIVAAVGMTSVIGSAVFFVYLPKDFIPDEDIGFIFGHSLAAEGTSPEKMCNHQREVNSYIQQDPAVDSFVSIASYSDWRSGFLFIKLKPTRERPSSFEVIERLHNKLETLPGVMAILKNVPLVSLSTGPTARGAYQYALQSLDTNALYDSAEELVKQMRTLPEFQSVTSDLAVKDPHMRFTINKDKAASLGLTAEQIETALQLGYAGGRVSQIQSSVDQYDIVLEIMPEFQRDVAALSMTYVRSLSGRLVPLDAVASWSETVGPAAINHIDQFPSVTVSFNLVPGVALGTALAKLDELARQVLPPTVSGSGEGAVRAFEESVKNLTLLLFVAILAIYLVLGILYESFVHPLTILSTLPPAVLGALATLWMFGETFSLYAFLGLLLLLGIVKKNGIMMVDCALENIRTKGCSAEQAIVEACLVRLRPIMMTTFTAVMGALPIVIGMGIGAEARRPLGLVIVGGLIFSQMITLFFTPVVYLYLHRFEKRSTASTSVPVPGPVPD